MGSIFAWMHLPAVQLDSSALEHPERTVSGALDHLNPGGTAAFLSFTRADSAIIRGVVKLFTISFRGAAVDLKPLTPHPYFVEMKRYGSGYVTLAEFQRPLNS